MASKSASYLFFALTMIVIGVMGIVGGNFAPIWLPVPEMLPHRQLLADLSALLSLAAGAGLLMKRTAAGAALSLLAFLLIWTALFKIPIILRAPLVEVSYQSTGQNAVLIAAAWNLFASPTGEQRRRVVSPTAQYVGWRIAHVLYGLALIAFGLAQFIYLNLTLPLVPWWLPEPLFWAYLTGGIYITTGGGMVTGIAPRLMAAISALQIAIITLLVWGSLIPTDQMTELYWREAAESWALTAGSWVVAASFKRRPWLEVIPPLRDPRPDVRVGRPLRQRAES